MTSKKIVDKKRDWERYYCDTDLSSAIPEPAKVLTDYAYLLPQQGKALDLACGFAGNAFFLAQQGLDSYAWDSADAALHRVRVIAKQFQVQLQLEHRDIELRPPENNSFDVLVVSRFLCRSLIPQLIAALRPQGLLFYQTFLREKPPGLGPSNPEFLLKNNELLQLFAQLRILVYIEQGLVGDTKCGIRNEALLVAQKV